MSAPRPHSSVVDIISKRNHTQLLNFMDTFDHIICNGHPRTRRPDDPRPSVLYGVRSTDLCRLANRSPPFNRYGFTMRCPRSSATIGVVLTLHKLLYASLSSSII